MSQPTTADGHELCEKSDPNASHYWCSRFADWMNSKAWRPSITSDHPCGEYWQRPVQVEKPVRCDGFPYIEKWEDALEQARAESAYLRGLVEKYRKVFKELKPFTGHFPAPFSSRDRLPTERDAVNEQVLYWSPDEQVWLNRRWTVHFHRELFWMTPPPDPTTGEKP